MASRFYFHLTDGRTFEDEDGERCSSLEAARAHAVRIAHELANEPELRGYAVKVTDENGNQVARVPLVDPGK
jgi:hypothetical protein